MLPIAVGRPRPSTRESLRGCLVGGVSVAVVWTLLSFLPANAVGTTTPAVVFVLVVLVATIAGGLVSGLGTALFSFVALTYGFAAPRHSFAIHDAKTAIALAVFVVIAAVVSLLAAAQSEARAQVEAIADENDRLQRLTAALSRARTATGVYDAVMAEGRQALRAQAGMIVSREGDEIELLASFGFTEVERAGWERFPASLHTPIADAMVRRTAIFLELGDRERLYPEIGGEGPATASLPLLAAGEVIGALGFRFEGDRVFTDSERAFAGRLAEQSAHALERARLFDAERRARGALALLAAAGEQLARSLDPADALRTLAELVTPDIAQQCIIDLVEDGAIRRIVVANADPALEREARALEDYAPALEADTPVARVMRTGRSELVPVVRDLPASAYRDERHQQVVERLALRCLLSVPLVARGRTLGTMTFGAKQPYGFDAETMALAEQLARRVALAIDNADLYARAERERVRLDALLRQLPLGVVIAEAPTGRRVLTNQRAVAILAAAELAQAADFDAIVRRAVLGQATAAEEVELRHEDGKRTVLVVSAEPVREADGEVVAAVVSLFDLTEHRENEERLAFLASASSVLTSSLDSERTLEELARLAVPRIADWCSIDLVEHGTLRNVAVAHVDPAKVALARELQERYPPDMNAPSGTAAVIRTGRSEFFPEIPDALLEAASPDADLLAILRELGLRSAITVPLTARGRTIGTLSLIAAESGRRYSAADVSLAEDLAARASLAVDNARLYEAQRAIAHTLQQSLLPGRLPQPPGVDVAVGYLPAGLGAEVGGDFYDGWAIDGGYAFAIGDVTGKGPDAAALTSLTRHAMRIASRFLSSPRRILDVVNDAILRETDGTQFCTAILAMLRIEDGVVRITLSCAGHPPPLVISAGTVRSVGELGTLLGVVPDPLLEDATAVLEPGSVLVCWTDGVTERRRDGELYGDDRLGAVLARLAGSTAAEVVRGVEAEVVAYAPTLPEDDIAILALGVTGSLIRSDGGDAADARPAPAPSA